MSVGFQTSIKNHNADSLDDKVIGFSSNYYMHSIGQTEFVKTTQLEQAKSHLFGYIPILFSFSEDPSNAGHYKWAGFDNLTGTDGSKIQIAYASGAKIRFYALYQGI